MKPNLKAQNTDFSLHTFPLNPLIFGGTVLLKLVSVPFRTEGSVLNVYTLYPCLVSCYGIAVNTRMCLRINKEKEGDCAELSLSVIPTQEKTWGAPFSSWALLPILLKLGTPVADPRGESRQAKV